MRLSEFVKKYREDIDAIINSVIYRYDGKGGRGSIPVPAPKYSDAERADWVENDEGLYNWWKGSR